MNSESLISWKMLCAKWTGVPSAVVHHYSSGIQFLGRKPSSRILPLAIAALNGFTKNWKINSFAPIHLKKNRKVKIQEKCASPSASGCVPRRLLNEETKNGDHWTHPKFTVVQHFFFFSFFLCWPAEWMLSPNRNQSDSITLYSAVRQCGSNRIFEKKVTTENITNENTKHWYRYRNEKMLKSAPLRELLTWTTVERQHYIAETSNAPHIASHRTNKFYSLKICVCFEQNKTKIERKKNKKKILRIRYVPWKESVPWNHSNEQDRWYWLRKQNSKQK